MNNYLALDIETVKNDYADLFFELGLGKASARLKDPKKIEAAKEKLKEKCALQWWLGKTCMIATELIYENKYRTNPVSTSEKIFYGTDEVKLLKEFGNYLNELETDLNFINLIGKNGKGFDLPFLVGRYLRHDLGVPSVLRCKKALRDVDEMFSNWGDKSQTTTLINYAFGLGIDGKTDSFGFNNIQSWHDENNWDEMKKYCARDKDIVVEMLRRYRPYETTPI